MDVGFEYALVVIILSLPPLGFLVYYAIGGTRRARNRYLYRAGDTVNGILVVNDTKTPPRRTIDYWTRQELEQTPAWWQREFDRLNKPHEDAEIEGFVKCIRDRAKEQKAKADLSVLPVGGVYPARPGEVVYLSDGEYVMDSTLTGRTTYYRTG
jgi:hypothetical protein